MPAVDSPRAGDAAIADVPYLRDVRTNSTRVVVALAAATLVVAGRAALRTPLSQREIRCFRALNELSGAAYPVVWPVMQCGSLGGVVTAAAVTAAADRRDLGGRLLVAGTTTWSLAKATKEIVQRGRPGTTLTEWRGLGRPQSGLGFPSGHAAVVASLATVAAPALDSRWRPVLWSVVATTAFGRVYIGAHLPLDVVGGVALGHVVGAVVLAAESA